MECVYLSTRQRYYVLAECDSDFCVLRLYTRAIVSAWGVLPLGFKQSIPIGAMDEIQTVSKANANGSLLNLGSIVMLQYLCIGLLFICLTL